MLDCDTTGIEPDLALTKAKKLVGGGTMMIVNQTIPRALRKLGYSDEQGDAIVQHINEHKSLLGAPGFNPEHLRHVTQFNLKHPDSFQTLTPDESNRMSRLGEDTH